MDWGRKVRVIRRPSQFKHSVDILHLLIRQFLSDDYRSILGELKLIGKFAPMHRWSNPVQHTNVGTKPYATYNVLSFIPAV